MIGLAAGLALLLASPDADEIMLHLYYSEQDGTAISCGSPIDLFGGGAVLSGAGGIAGGMEALKHMDGLLQDAFQDPDSLPKTTGETITRYMSTPVAVLAATIPPTSSSYYASVDASLVYDQATRSYRVKEGTVTWFGVASGKMEGNGHLLYDRIKGSGTSPLKPGAVVITFQDGSAHDTLDPNGEPKETTYSLKLDIHHPTVLTGESGWIVDGGKVMSMRHRYGEGSTNLKITSLGKPAADENGPPCDAHKGVLYDSREREIENHQASFHESWLGAGGSQTNISWEITLPFELRYEPADVDAAVMLWGGREVDQQVLAQHASQMLVHANFRGRVLIEGVDQLTIDTRCGKPGNRVSSQQGYLIDRLARSWPLEGASSGDKPHWVSDPSDFCASCFGRREVSADDWLDLPGCCATTGHLPDTWTSGGTRTEFLVKVRNHPEFGYVHVAFIMESRGPAPGIPPAYRIAYAPPERLDAIQYRKVFSEGGPPAIEFQGESQWVNLVPGPNGSWTTELSPAVPCSNEGP